MNIILTINEKRQAMLLHDEKLVFTPEWVEFDHDQRVVRVIGIAGEEFRAGVAVDAATARALDDVNDILLVWMKRGDALEGHVVTFINQYYERQRPAGAIYKGAWDHGDS